ncbi:MAG: hypothetical protein EXR72_10085 [Myxococcales bacterium]|nr:hypothetical protein [Myxococcales bacterium]
MLTSLGAGGHFGGDGIWIAAILFLGLPAQGALAVLALGLALLFRLRQRRGPTPVLRALWVAASALALLAGAAVFALLAATSEPVYAASALPGLAVAGVAIFLARRRAGQFTSGAR